MSSFHALSLAIVFLKADGALQGAAGKGMQGAAGKALHGQILGVISTQMWGEFDGAGAAGVYMIHTCVHAFVPIAKNGCIVVRLLLFPRT